jgi:hypothetical protein
VNNFEWKDLAGPVGVLLASIITQLVTIGVLFANQRLSYKRYAHEKLWDLRRELYSKMLSNLSEMVAIYVKVHGLYTLQGADEEHKRATLLEERIYFDELLEVQALFLDNQPIFSKAFADRFTLVYDVQKVDPTNEADYASVLAQRRRRIYDAHASLLEQAQRELGTNV